MKFLLLIHFGLDDILYVLLNWFILMGGIVLFFGLIWSAFRSLPKSSPEASQQNEPDVATPQSEIYNARINKED